MTSVVRWWAVVMVLGALCASCAGALDRPYDLVSWAYGVLVWWDGLDETDLASAEAFVRRLGDAVGEAYGFWGFDPPEMAGMWERPVVHFGKLRADGSRITIVDEAMGLEIDVPALRWGDRELSPLVVIAFRSDWRMHDALGATATFAAQFFFGPAAPSYPKAEEWLSEVGQGDRTMICGSHAGDDVLIHELAHWFLVEWCEANGVEPWALPNYILEGVAETTAAGAEEARDAAWERRAALDWAERHCLADGVGAASQYSVGGSLVAYLVGDLGIDGFLGTLGEWASQPEVVIDRYEPGWRESLGLPSVYETDPDAGT